MKKSKLYMDTVVEIEIAAGERFTEEEQAAMIDQGFEAFRQVEQACSRFSPDSELMLACSKIGVPVPVGPFLFEPLKFALELAAWTRGIYDPAVGKLMEEHGFNRRYLTGERMVNPAAGHGTYRDIVLNDEERTLYLRKPLILDLGSVAKGFAVDLAAHELSGCEGYMINAGGDLYAGGTDENGEPWEIGIRHPEQEEQMIAAVHLSNQAVCTSGSYIRKSLKKAGMHHLIDPTTGQSPDHWVSCSVVAPYAMMADAFSTASFLLGAEEGKRLIERAGLQGIFITSDLRMVRAVGISMTFGRWLKSPKGYVSAILTAYLIITSAGAHSWKGIGNALAAVFFAVVIDILCGAATGRKRNVPDGAVITGLIVALILSTTMSWSITAATAVLSIISKHLLASRKKPIFNPAAFGLLLSVPLFHAEQSWWGAFGDLPAWTMVFVLIGGYAVAGRIHKYPQVFSFLGTTFILLFLMGHFHAGAAYDAFRPPFVNASLFFGFFMLTDPPTSPAKTKHQVIFGMLTALAGTAVYSLFGGLMYLYIGLAAGNLYQLLFARTAGKSAGSRRQLAKSGQMRG